MGALCSAGKEAVGVWKPLDPWGEAWRLVGKWRRKRLAHARSPAGVQDPGDSSGDEWEPWGRSRLQ